MTFYVYWFVDVGTGLPFYIGKGHDRPGYNRPRAHELLAKNRKHYNKPFQARIRRGDYTVIRVASNLSEEDAYVLEGHQIDEYGLKHLGGGLFNLVDSTARGGYSWDDTRRAAQSQQKLSKQTGLPVTQYTLTGILVEQFPSAKVASEHTGANRSYITQVCKGHRKQAGGFIWTYSTDPAPTTPYQTVRGRRIEQLSGAGEHIAYHTSGRALRMAGFKFRSILDCCRGKAKSSQGFLWRYAD